jgi:large subunit ribosomal protein L18
VLNKKSQRLRRAARGRFLLASSGLIRLSVHRTSQHIYASLIDGGRVLTTVSSLGKSIVSDLKEDVLTRGGRGVSQAKIVGSAVAKKAIDLGIQRVAFDRSGFAYHGRIKALAEAARSAGLQF